MANLLFEKLRQTLSANQQWKIGMAGNFFRVSDATNPVTVSLLKDNMIIGTMSNIQAGDYSRDVEFDAVIVTNGTTSQQVTVQIAAGGAGSDRVTGEVSVINGEISRVNNGQCFIGGAGVPAVAGQNSLAQLFNPVGSGKRLVLNKLNLSSTGTGGFGFYVRAGLLPGTTDGVVINKRLGWIAPSAQFVYTTTALGAITPFGNVSSDAAKRTVEYSFSEPILIPENSSIVVYTGDLNVTMFANMQWYEI